MIEELTLTIAAEPGATLPGRGDTVKLFDSKGAVYVVKIHRVLRATMPFFGTMAITVIAETTRCSNDSSAK